MAVDPKSGLAQAYLLSGSLLLYLRTQKGLEADFSKKYLKQKSKVLRQSLQTEKEN